MTDDEYAALQNKIHSIQEKHLFNLSILQEMRALNEEVVTQNAEIRKLTEHIRTMNQDIRQRSEIVRSLTEDIRKLSRTIHE